MWEGWIVIASLQADSILDIPSYKTLFNFSAPGFYLFSKDMKLGLLP
jgi:hypothetical protein